MENFSQQSISAFPLKGSGGGVTPTWPESGQWNLAHGGRGACGMRSSVSGTPEWRFAVPQPTARQGEEKNCSHPCRTWGTWEAMVWTPVTVGERTTEGETTQSSLVPG